MLGDPRNENSLSTKMRRRRDIQLRALIDDIHSAKGSVSILDMGGTIQYWERVGLDYLRERKVSIVLVNREAAELGSAGGDGDLFQTAVGDACDLPQYGDGQFDLAHSNSVIEHVETWGNMKAFARETRRTGKAYYIQTPYFWFPVDPHYYRMPLFHWFPRPIRARMLNALPITYVGRVQGIDMAYEVVDRARLLDGRQFRFLFPDGEISFERFAGLPKSMVAIRR